MATRTFAAQTSPILKSASHTMLKSHIIAELPRPTLSQMPSPHSKPGKIVEPVVVDEEGDPVQNVLNRTWTRPKPPTEPPTPEAAGPEGARGGRRQPHPRRHSSLPLLTVAVGSKHLDAAGESSAKKSGRSPFLPLPDTISNGRRTPDGPQSPLSDTMVTRKSKPNGRRWTLDLMKADEGDGMSPKWIPARERRNSCTLEYKHTASNIAEPDDSGHSADKNDGGQFAEMARTLQTTVNRTVMRINDDLEAVRARHRDDESHLENATNKGRLEELCHLLGIVNYRLGKWLHQLMPDQHSMPRKPSKQEDHCPLDLLAEVSYSCSRMELSVSLLAPLVQKIIADARAMRPGAGGDPPTPTFRNPARLAQKRGISNVDELYGMTLHLEHALQVSQSLAHKPVPSKSFDDTAVALMAASRFKTLLKRRASAPAPEVFAFLDQ